MQKKYSNTKWVIEELPLNTIEEDFNQPRKNFGLDGDEENNRLIKSLKRDGLEEPLKILKVEKKDNEDRYIIIDGHRRYRAAQRLEWESAPCCVYSNMDKAEMESRRYQIQNNRRPWSPIEKSQSISTIKEAMGITKYKDLGSHLGLSDTTIANSLKVRDLTLSILDKMARYDLNESFYHEVVRLHPKLRKVGKYEIEQIINDTIERIRNGIITSAKQLRILGRVFKRKLGNEEIILQYLDDKTVSVEELAEKTDNSGLIIILEAVIKRIRERQNKEKGFSDTEKKILTDIKKLINQI